MVEDPSAIRIRTDIPSALAALIGCPVATGDGSVTHSAGARQDDSAAVFGCGGVGLNAVQGARLVGALPIIAVDTNPDRLTLARELGATHTIQAGAADVPAEILRLTGRGVDVAVVAVGSTAVMEEALGCTAPGGTCVLVGLPPAGTTMVFRPHLLLYGERRLIGSQYGSVNPAGDFPQLVEQYLAGRLRLDELVTRRYRPEEANQAFADLAAGANARGLIVFPG